MTQHRTREDLSPCPFCGCAAERHDIMDEEPANFGGSVIQCTRCLCSTRVIFGEKEGLYESWNTRATSALRTENERLLEALEMLIADCQQYPAYERPCFALDVAESAVRGDDHSPERTLPDNVIAALATAKSAVRTDRERMDWLEGAGPLRMWRMCKGRHLIHGIGDQVVYEGTDLRAAIDAAMNSTIDKPKEQS